MIMKSFNKYIYLSHVIGGHTPGYGGKPGFSSKQVMSICCGQSCNQSEWTMSNHIGTHIDSSFHFCDEGKTLDSHEADFWFFDLPQLITLPVNEARLITADEIESLVDKNADLLLIKTHFELKRGTEDYWSKNPGLSPELGMMLREKFPRLRCIGFDFISVTSYQHRPEGKLAHKSLLEMNDKTNPILPIEDMHLSELTKSPKRVVVLPLRVDKSDGSPVTVIAEME